MVALLDPLQEGGELTAAAARAMEELVVTGRPLLRSKLRGLPPLPQAVPGLERVAEVLKQERGALTVEEQVRLLLQSLQHDSPSVQATAVQVSLYILRIDRNMVMGLQEQAFIWCWTHESFETHSRHCRLQVPQQLGELHLMKYPKSQQCTANFMHFHASKSLLHQIA